VAQAPQVAIIELGSQYTLVIERTLRELGVRAVILDPKRALPWLTAYKPKAVILSGGAASVYDKDAPQPPAEVLNLKNADGNPVAILGICYGMQWLAHRLGGKVEPIEGRREYGETKLILTGELSLLFNETPQEQVVWASHGDSVTTVPPDFRVLATSLNNTPAAMANGNLIFGVQFHPEVTHTENGKKILANFLALAGCKQDWQPNSVITEIQGNVWKELGGIDSGNKAIFGFSGGVDSTTLGRMLGPMLGPRLTGVVIDGGHLREGELKEIHAHAEAADVRLEVINVAKAFQTAMASVTDAEEKRKRFRIVYAATLMAAARKFGAKFLLQGTLATDRIESGATGGATIKTHHNVGLEMRGLVQLHPLGHLFKHEVRALARSLELPESVWNRQPFPGPGLFLRVVGTPATTDKLEVVRWADARVREITLRHGLYPRFAQLIVAYLGVNTVGVKGDGRVYGGSIVVRAVTTQDFMTARGVYLPEEVAREISSTLTSDPRIVRVFYDPTDKPPATTEME